MTHHNKSGKLWVITNNNNQTSATQINKNSSDRGGKSIDKTKRSCGSIVERTAASLLRDVGKLVTRD